MSTTEPTATRDPLTELAEIRQRAEDERRYVQLAPGDELSPADDVLRLAAGYDALLAVAAWCEQKSAKLWEQISGELDSKGAGPELRAAAASAYSNAATKIREAITDALRAPYPAP